MNLSQLFFAHCHVFWAQERGLGKKRAGGQNFWKFWSLDLILVLKIGPYLFQFTPKFWLSFGDPKPPDLAPFFDKIEKAHFLDFSPWTLFRVREHKTHVLTRLVVF